MVLKKSFESNSNDGHLPNLSIRYDVSLIMHQDRINITEITNLFWAWLITLQCTIKTNCDFCSFPEILILKPKWKFPEESSKANKKEKFSHFKIHHSFFFWNRSRLMIELIKIEFNIFILIQRFPMKYSRKGNRIMFIIEMIHCRKDVARFDFF